MDKLFENEYGRFGIDPEDGAIWFVSSIIDPEEDDIQVTEGGSEYSIFVDDEIEDAIHIEINPNFVWCKDDVWELVDHLLFAIGEIDEDGNLIGDNSEKPLFVINVPGNINQEQATNIGLAANQALVRANIEAVPLVLSDGITTYFDRP